MCEKRELKDINYSEDFLGFLNYLHYRWKLGSRTVLFSEIVKFYSETAESRGYDYTPEGIVKILQLVAEEGLIQVMAIPNTDDSAIVFNKELSLMFITKDLCQPTNIGPINYAALMLKAF